MEDKKANVRRNLMLTVIGLVAVLSFTGIIYSEYSINAGVITKNGTVLAAPLWNLSQNAAGLYTTLQVGINISGTYTFNVSFLTAEFNNATNASFYLNDTYINVGPICSNTTVLPGNNIDTLSFRTCTVDTSTINAALRNNKTYVLSVNVTYNSTTVGGHFNQTNATVFGWAGTSTFNVTIDNTKPNILSIASPSAGSVYSGFESREILLNYTVNDTTAGVRTVFFALGNSTGNFSSLGTSGATVIERVSLGTLFVNDVGAGADHYNITFDPRNFRTGTYTIYMNVTDHTTSGTTAGNVVTNMTRTIVIDNDTPVITIVSPAANDIIKDSTPWIQIKVSDGDQMRQGATDYKSCKYWIDNTTARVFNSTGTSSGIEFDTFVAINEFKIQHAETLSNNAHNIFVICQDRAGNNGTKAWTFSVDTDRGGGAGPSGRAADIDLGTETTSALSGSQGRVTTFTLGTGDTHTVTITGVTDDSVTLKIESEPIILTLKTGETKKVDVTGDTVDDVSITLNAITDGNADLTITKLQAPAAPAGEQVAPAKTGGAGLTAVIVIVVIIAVAGIGYYAYSKKKK